VRERANTFAAGIIELAQSKYNLKEFKQKILMDRVVVSSNPQISSQTNALGNKKEES
jgi:hypothetical protein